MNPEQQAAMRRIAFTIADIINEHGEGIPGGHMYAMLMQNMSLQNFEAIMSVLVRLGKITKRGDCYYPGPSTETVQ